MKLKLFIICLLFFAALPAKFVYAQLTETSIEDSKNTDTDSDGLSDYLEINIYRTNFTNPDTDGDGFMDGDEIKFAFDPNKAGDDRLQKSILVTLADQNLSYKLGDYIIESFKISSGLRNATPAGEFSVLVKKPVVNYKGPGYDYSGTRWNLMFKKQAGGNLYIHGAYWHNNFGQPMSHGCVNVAYANVEALYNWADVGTKVTIK